jgi:A/G-specific adenine glycosylase
LRDPSPSGDFDAPELDPSWLRSFRRRVLAWYGKHGRDLPWRRDRDPYRVWVSEVMLQQTTVAAVVPYFERFLARFPTVEALASADVHDVMRLWEGLGYYSRARNMHAAAQRIVAGHGGEFPRTAAELSALKGIGRYTAGAIASFAFDEPAPIVEANTIRLYCRLMGYRGDPRSGEGQKRLWSFAERIVPKKDAGRFNHALMDLGATVCTVKNPRCDACPVRANCRAFALGLQNEIPPPKSRPAVTDVTEAYVAVRKGSAYLLRRREAGERWAGLWDFPRCELTPTEAAEIDVPEAVGQKSLSFGSVPAALTRRLEDVVAEQTGVSCRIGEPLAEFRHGVTRFRIRLVCFSAEYRGGIPAGEARWIPAEEFHELALSRTGRRLAGFLMPNHTGETISADKRESGPQP